MQDHTEPDPVSEQAASPVPTETPLAVRRRRMRRVVLGRRMRRRTRWFLRVVLALPLLCVALAFVALRSPLVGWLAEDALERAVGCDARTDSSHVTFDGRIVLKGIALRVPGIDGLPGQFLFVERVEIDADWSDVFGAGVKPTGVRLYRPTFRVSARESDAVLNIQALHPSDPGAGQGDVPMRIDVIEGTLELGEHSPTDYRVLRRIGISGALTPVEGQPGEYLVRFHETRSGGAGLGLGPGMALDGRVNLEASLAKINLLNVDLTTWSPTDVPTSMRDVWEQLNIKGKIASTSLDYFPATGPTAVITLENVSMDAIVPARITETGPTADVLSLREVHGTVKISSGGLDADVAGLIEDQQFPSRVQLKTQALTTDAALECRITSRGFRLQKDPTLLPFCPPVVGDRLANFGGPTAVVDANVLIRRDAPTPEGASPFRVAGWLEFEHGEAAFDRVPYPFHDIRGRVDFDDKAIEIRRIEGVGPSGARLTARGRIAPPTHEAAVEIFVNVRGVPLDDTFVSSLPASRAEAVDFLFSRSHYDELLAAGLVRGPDAPDADGAPPVFALGGEMDLDLEVRTPHGRDSPWTYDVEVSIPRAGVLPRAFPMPIDATGVRLHLSDTEARLMDGSFAGLTGATTSVRAHVLLEDAGKPVLRPTVGVDATGVPLDPLLLFAIEQAAPGDGAPDAGDSLTPAQLMRALDLRGTVDSRASINSSADGSIAFDIGVKFDELRAAPAGPGVPAALELVDIAGSIGITNTSLRVPRLTAAVRALAPTAAAVQEIAAGTDLGWLGVTLDAELRGIDTSLEKGPGESRSRPSIAGARATLDLTGFELLAPLESTVAALSPEIAARLAALRDEHQPSGRVSATATITREEAASPVHAEVVIDAAENFSFDLGGERLESTLRAGKVRVAAGDEADVRFERAEMEVGVGNAPRSPLVLEGGLVLRGEGGADEWLRISGEGVSLESGLLTLSLRHALSPGTLESFTNASPRGLLDASMRIPSRAFAGPDAPDLSGVRAEIIPRTLSFDFEQTRVEIGAFEGALLVEPGRVRLASLVARAEDWRASVDGAWEFGADRPGGLEADLEIDADSLTPGIRALLPRGLLEQFDAMQLSIVGPLRAEETRVVYAPGGASSITGVLQFEGANLDIGAPLSEAAGRLALHAERPAGAGGTWAFGLDIWADRLHAAGLEMTDMRSLVHVNRTPGVVELERLDADCYAGRVSARARVSDAGPSGHTEQQASSYEAEITMAGVCFAPVLEALETARKRQEGLDVLPIPTELAADPSRGRLDGTLAISGTTGTSRRRSGVGSMRISGGDVVQMPLVLTLVQLSNLRVALNDRLDFVQALFHVHDRTVVFDQIDLLSTSVAISGRGTMTWPEQELDLRFNSRGRGRVPVVSDLLETVRDELATTHIRGTLGDPRVAPEPFTGTRDLIGSMMGDQGGPRKATGLPDAAAERRRQRSQQPHAPASRPAPAGNRGD